MAEQVLIKAIFTGITSKGLTVTDQRIYGNDGAGQSFDIPISSIYSVSIGDMGSTLSITTKGRQLRFSFVKNGKTVCNTIQNLINNRKTNENTAGNDEPMFVHGTVLNTITVYKDYCEIEQRKSAVNLLMSRSVLGMNKKIYYSDLTSIEYTKPAAFAEGTIKFIMAGHNNVDNVYFFNNKEIETVQQIYDYIDRRIREIKTAPKQAPQQPVSAADEIAKFKNLLDMGAITQEEFDAKKKQLLGL